VGPGPPGECGRAGYVAVNIFAEAARLLGPNLTRDRLMAEPDNGTSAKREHTWK
jgi:hypothetical protein